jgi:hypothetical protein
VESLFCGLTFHHRCNFLFDLYQLLKVVELELLNHFTKHFVTFFLRALVVYEKFDTTHNFDIIRLLKLNFLDQRNDNVQFEHD